MPLREHLREIAAPRSGLSSVMGLFRNVIGRTLGRRNGSKHSTPEQTPGQEMTNEFKKLAGAAARAEEENWSMTQVQSSLSPFTSRWYQYTATKPPPFTTKAIARKSAASPDKEWLLDLILFKDRDEVVRHYIDLREHHRRNGSPKNDAQ